MYTIFDMFPDLDPAQYTEIMTHNFGVASAAIGGLWIAIFGVPLAVVGSMMSSMGMY